jgi:hypothetical protein
MDVREYSSRIGASSRFGVGRSQSFFPQVFNRFIYVSAALGEGTFAILDPATCSLSQILD